MLNTYSYSFYGLRLTSDWMLPYPASVAPEGGFGRIVFRDAPADTFTAALRNAAELSADDGWHQCVRFYDGIEYLRWAGLFEFLVSSSGRQVMGHPLGSTSSEAFHTYLLGQVLSHALLKLGLEPLHATAAVVDGRAVAFMADCGSGKSSLAAFFISQGCPLLTDDLLVLEPSEHEILAHPGPPRIKLFPETAAELLPPEVSGRAMNQFTRKIVIPLERGQSYSRAAPLQTIYVLSAPASVRRITIRRLTPRQALVELLRNTFNRDVKVPSRLEQLFRNAAWLSSVVPIKVLRYPRDYTILPVVHDAIVRDINADLASSTSQGDEGSSRMRLAG